MWRHVQLVLSSQYACWLAIALLGAGVIALLVVALRMGRRLARLERQQRELIAGTDGGNLEQILGQHLTRLQEMTADLQGMRGRIGELEAVMPSAVRHVGMIRFNAFADMGGDTSFALALADAVGNGCVLYSLHGRGEARLYAKPLEGWTSSYALADEELEAVRRARAAGAPEAKLAS